MKENREWVCSSMAEQIAHNDLVLGSSPSTPTKGNGFVHYEETNEPQCSESPTVVISLERMEQSTNK